MENEIKIIPVDAGYIIKAYEKGGDLRIPIKTVVAATTEDLLMIINSFYSVPQSPK